MANFNIDYLVVAGGGGGASAYGASGAGGGAGEYLYKTAQSLTFGGSGYTVTVGDGGIGGQVNNSTVGSAGAQGDDSVFIQTTKGGGFGRPAGGSPAGVYAGSDGGSGGGGTFNGAGGASIATSPGLGFAGGAGYSTANYGSGGGGGAGSAGINGTSTSGGNGGVGMQNSITGTATFYAAGGGGGLYNSINTQGIGGSGIGGSSYYNQNATSGAANTGSGGGGASYYSSNIYLGGNGGSGVVILRYTTSDVASYTTTGITPTETTDGTYTVLSFTTVGTGTITFTSSTPANTFDGTRVTTPVTDFNKTNTTQGLKLPSGTNGNQPAGVDAIQSMLRNNTGETVNSSASALTHYNGTNWRYFAATESVDNPIVASQNFNTVLYDGSNNVKTINTVGFQPDLVWVKCMDVTNSHVLSDSLRGDSTRRYPVFPDLNNAESTTSNQIKTIDPDGFTAFGNSNAVNRASQEYVAWNWKGGGLINQSADFNGSSSYVNLPSNPISGTGDYSVSVWAKCDDLNAGQSGQQYITQFGSIASSGGGTVIAKWQNNSASANKIYIHVGGGYVLTSHVVVLGAWTHYTVTQTGTSILFYVNGNLQDTLTAPSSPNRTSGNSSIGYYTNGGHSYFGGNIQQARIFNSVLAPSEVTELYNETAADNSILNYPTGAGCVAAYPLGENANGLDGLYNGTASNVTFDQPGYLTRNNDGTVESTVSANVAAGFSIVKYNSGTSAITAGHGLSQAVEMVICKPLVSGVWAVWNKYMATDLDKNYIPLTSAAVTPNASSLWNYSNWGATKIGSNNPLMFGNSNDVICYCWHSVPGYSKIGSYTGNGNTTGVLQELGFEPAFLMFKCVTQSGNWIIIDNKRATSNPRTPHLRANTSGQDDYGANEYVDFTSTGFQPKGVSNYNNNSLGQTYIYMAFATS